MWNGTQKVFQIIKNLIWPREESGSYPKSNQKLPNNLNQSGGPVICVIEKNHSGGNVERGWVGGTWDYIGWCYYHAGFSEAKAV